MAKRAPRHKTNRTALEATIAALATMGRLEKVDAAKVHTARSLAAELDGEGAGNANLWKQYREAVSDLVGDGSSSDALDELTRFMQAQVGDTTPA